MLLETPVQKLAKVIWHVCNALSNWETAPLHLMRALPIETEMLPILSRLIHCDFSNHVEA